MASLNLSSSTSYYYNFKKPSNKLPTCYLYIPVFKILKNTYSIQQIFHTFFQKFGDVKHIEIKPAFKFQCAYIVYENISDAILASQNVNDPLCALNSYFEEPLSCRFATIEVNKKIDFQIVCDISDRNISNKIPGLILIDDFISRDDEKELLNLFDNNIWRTDFSRRVQHYGYEFDYTTRNINLLENLGDLSYPLNKIANKISETCSTSQLNQVTVNEYEAGQGLAIITIIYFIF